jgi:hypothetical protein
MSYDAPPTGSTVSLRSSGDSPCSLVGVLRNRSLSRARYLHRPAQPHNGGPYQKPASWCPGVPHVCTRLSTSVSFSRLPDRAM